MEFNSILMWIFAIILIVGLVLSYREIKTGKHYVTQCEGPILVTIGLVASILVGMMSSEKVSEGFCEAFGFK